MPKPKDIYTQIIEWIFRKYYQEGENEFSFDRQDIITAANDLGIKLPKNLGDVLYSFRYRKTLPEFITARTSEGFEWMIRPAGRGRYTMAMAEQSLIVPSKLLAETKVLDATPGIINKYALNDEQALLAKRRYNRLIDIFTGLTCYSLQSHLRTAVIGLGQIETDEIYIGVDRLGIVQIEQDFALCSSKFPDLLCRAIAAQFMESDLIALFELEQTSEGVRVTSERHYRLVSPENLSVEELSEYRRRPL